MIKQKSNPTKKISNTQLEAQLKRSLADYQNLEKRFKTDKVEFIKFASASLVDKLLSVLDDLERAENHLKDKGLKITVEQFRQVLFTEGVKELKVSGTAFDPQTSDCAELVNGPKNKIINIIQKGYSLNGRVLRPAKVKVGQGG